MTVTATPVPLLSLSLVPWPVDQSCGHLFFKIVNYQRYFPASIPSVTCLGKLIVSVSVSSKFLSMTYPALLEHPSSVDWKNKHSCDFFKSILRLSDLIIYRLWGERRSFVVWHENLPDSLLRLCSILVTPLIGSQFSILLCWRLTLSPLPPPPLCIPWEPCDSPKILWSPLSFPPLPPSYK